MSDDPIFFIHMMNPYGPRHEKTCPRGVQQSEFQTSHLSYRDLARKLKFHLQQVYLFYTYQ